MSVRSCRFFLPSLAVFCSLPPSSGLCTKYLVQSYQLWRLICIQHTPLSCWVFYQCANFAVLTQEQGKLQVSQSLGYNRFILFNEVWVILWQNWAAIPAEPFSACTFLSAAHLWGVQPKPEINEDKEERCSWRGYSYPLLGHWYSGNIGRSCNMITSLITVTLVFFLGRSLASSSWPP